MQNDETAMTRLIERGDLIPHFEVRTIAGSPVAYSTVWQHRNLVLVTMPSGRSAAGDAYVAELSARLPEFRVLEAECVVTADPIAGIQSPSVVIADRWGEVMFVQTANDVAGLPAVQELLDWVNFVQFRCPECEGEAK
jgi:hypothetical protein